MSSSLNYITAINVQKQYYYDLNFKADLDKKMVEQKEFKDVQLQNKCHNDNLAYDPYWINGVNYHASLSRHNYIR